MADPRDLYERTILDHARSPRNLRAIDPCDRCVEGANPLCGDEVTVYLSLTGDTVEDAAFEGRGCAVSTAAASILIEALGGLAVAEAEARVQAFLALLEGASFGEEQLGELAVFSRLADFPGRVRCASLAARALLAALRDEPGPVTTESS